MGSLLSGNEREDRQASIAERRTRPQLRTVLELFDGQGTLLKTVALKPENEVAA
jgi:hypothetical protein